MNDERDLDAEQAAFEQRQWVFRVHSPADTSVVNSRDPRVRRSFLAKARKEGSDERFQAEASSADAARAKLLDVMFNSIPITDK